MKWTSKKPTKAGWYWWYGGEDTEICPCEITENDIATGGNWLGGQWAGPIPMPEEP